MAYLNPPLKYRAPSVSSVPMQFQRGLEKAPVKKVQRKVVVTFRHIVLFFFIIAAVFFALTKFYLFLITWDELDVKRTQIFCQHDFVARELSPLLDASKLGNLLVLDIARLQSQVESHRWVKVAQLRKVFPSSLEVEIKERIPAAVLKSGSQFLVIDEEGVLLGRLASREDAGLPLLLDSAQFQSNYREKLALAWACFKSLSPGDQAEVEAIDLSESDNAGLYLKGQTTRLILGADRFSEKLEAYREYKDRLESENGPLEYIDLRFDDRIYFKTLPVPQGTALSYSKEEGK